MTLSRSVVVVSRSFEIFLVLKYQMWVTGTASSMCPILSRLTREWVTSTPHLSHFTPR